MTCKLYLWFALAGTSLTSFSLIMSCGMQDGVGCPESFLHALDYSQVAGLFAGMICLGLVVDQIGRKWASVTTARHHVCW